MREFTVMFRSVQEISDFVTLSNRQSFSVQLVYHGLVLDANSILCVSYMGLNKPIGVRLRDDAQSEAFCAAIRPYLIAEPA